MKNTSLDITYPKTPKGMSDDEWKARVDLAAVYRLTDYYGWTSVVYNHITCLLYTSPSPRDKRQSRMPSSA